MKPDLDIGVVVPTRNSMPHIRDHVEALNQWIGRVKEVVVVDSQSVDGTVDYIRENLLHSNLVIIDHPPGLYESWNMAIRRVKSKYTYIATVNDFMPIQSIIRLYQEAERLSADVAVSAPRIVVESRKAKCHKWPIHRFLETSGIDESYRMSPLEVLVWNFVDLPGTLIGSSASNIYRTIKLQTRPFSADYGHAGDSAWALNSSLDSQWVVVPRVDSVFWYHGGGNSEGRRGRKSRSKLYSLAIDQIHQFSDTSDLKASERELLNSLRVMGRLWEQREGAVLEYLELRDRMFPWFFIPRAWEIRSRRNRLKVEASCLVESVLLQLSKLGANGGKHKI